MIIPKQGFKKSYRYGGRGIFDAITKLLMRIFTSGAAKQLASSALDVGTKVAKEGAKKALEVGATAAADAGKRLVQKAPTPKSKNILEKYSPPPPQPQNINSLIAGSAVNIQNLLSQLSRTCLIGSLAHQQIDEKLDVNRKSSAVSGVWRTLTACNR